MNSAVQRRDNGSGEHMSHLWSSTFFFLCPYSIINIQTIEMFFTWNYGMWTVFYFLNLKCKYATNRFIIMTFFAWTLSVCFVFFSNYVRPLAIPLILISLKRTKSCYFVLQNDKLTREMAYWMRFMIFDAAFYGNASFSAQFMSDLVWHRDSFWRTLNFCAFHTSDEYLIAFLTFVFEQIKSHFHLDFYSRIWMLRQINVSTQILCSDFCVSALTLCIFDLDRKRIKASLRRFRKFRYAEWESEKKRCLSLRAMGIFASHFIADKCQVAIALIRSGFRRKWMLSSTEKKVHQQIHRAIKRFIII